MNLYYLRNILEILSLLSGPALVYIGWRALDQIQVMKRDTDIRISRERTAAAVEQMRIFAKEIIPSMDEGYKKFKLANIELIRFPLKKFTKNEWDSDDSRKQYSMKIVRGFYKNSNLKEELVDIVNALEASAVNFIGERRSVANEEIAFPSLSNIYCKFVEDYSFLYCELREEDNIANLFGNTIQLYKIWSNRRKNSN